MAKDYIIYQAYGNVAILTEVVLSILSIQSDAQVVIYTDQIDWFKAYPWINALFVPVDQQLLADWAGPIQFVHRVKIKILEDAAKRFEGRLLYLDSDTLLTFPTDDLFKKIGENQVLMHQNEGSLSGSPLKLNRRIGKFLLGKIWTINADKIEIPLQTEMYNAGVIGITTKNAQQVLPLVLALTDTLYDAWPKHIMEQLAFSYYLGQIGVFDTSKEVIHYWKLKQLRPQLISMVRAYQNQPRKDLAKAFYARFDFPVLIDKQTKWDKLPSIWRKFLTAIGQGWSLTNL